MSSAEYGVHLVGVYRESSVVHSWQNGTEYYRIQGCLGKLFEDDTVCSYST